MLCAVVRGWKLRAQRRGKYCDFRFKPLLPARRAQGIERSDAAKKTQKDRLYCVGELKNLRTLHSTTACYDRLKRDLSLIQKKIVYLQKIKGGDRDKEII